MAVKVHWQNDKYSMRATVYPLGDETCEQQWFHIDVSRGSDLTERGSWRPAEVNWPSYGAQNAETAKAFGEGLKKASEVAEEMNWPVKNFEVTFTVKRDGEVKTYTETWVGTHYKQIRDGPVPDNVTIDDVKDMGRV